MESIDLDKSLINKIIQSVADGFSEQLEFTKQLVRFPSLMGEETPAQDFMANAMAERGWQVDRWKLDCDKLKTLPGYATPVIAYDNSYNVVGSYRPRHRTGRSLILNGHIDVVPAGPEQHWETPPFEPSVRDGWMYGRGAADMKSGLVSCLFAMDALKRVGLQPAADVYTQSVVEEECTGNGALACLERGYRADAAIIPEPSNQGLVRAQVGLIWFQIQVGGDPTHASGAESAGTNAIEKAFHLYQALQQLEADWNARKVEHPWFAMLEKPIRFNLGKISGGDWTSSVPAWCSFDMRIGIYPGWSREDACAEVENCIRKAAQSDTYLRKHPPEISYRGFYSEGYALEPGSDAEMTLSKVHQMVFRDQLSAFTTPAASDARYFGLYADTPALVYGPNCRQIHGYNEAVEVDSIRKVTQSIALFIVHWCGLEPA